MTTDIAPVPEVEVREEITAKDMMRIMGWSRDKAYRMRTQYLKLVGKTDTDQPLVIDDFCKGAGLARERVVCRLVS